MFPRCRTSPEPSIAANLDCEFEYNKVFYVNIQRASRHDAEGEYYMGIWAEFWFPLVAMCRHQSPWDPPHVAVGLVLLGGHNPRMTN